MFFLFLLPSLLLTQDSLHLVGTITGEPGSEITDINGIGDVNGDGYDDFMVTIADKTIDLYLGSMNNDLTPSLTFGYPGDNTLNGALRIGTGVGDVNGDGYNDFIISCDTFDGACIDGRVFLYYGGLNIDTIPEYEFHDYYGEDSFGHEIESVGDINKDGFDDFIIGSSYNWSNGKGRAYLFYGGDSISFQRSVTFVDTAEANNPYADSFFGRSVANIGDVNTDGFEDIAIMAGFNTSGLMERVYVYYGGTTVDAIPDTVISRYDAEYFGEVKRMGDVNKDGRIDFCITGMATWYLNISEDSIIKVKGFSFNSGVETDCDINNDGFSDFIMGNISYWNNDSVMVGAAFVYLGGETIDTIYKYKFEGENKWDKFGRIVTTADINGDGFDELFILAPDYPDYNNPLGKIYIYSYKNLSQVEVSRETIPDKFILYQNYPNPFNPTTKISFTIPVGTRHAVSLRVFDLLGREVAALVDETRDAGNHSVKFDGSKLSSGVYFIRMSAQPQEGQPIVQVKKMLLMK
ncbi:MAG: FG-GAP repeat protein [Bacteroidetes bacterium]|nr:FG-GAP repeat protein [Bacteroidota bacterium]